MRARSVVAVAVAALLAVAPLASAAVSVVFAERFGDPGPTPRGLTCFGAAVADRLAEDRVLAQPPLAG